METNIDLSCEECGIEETMVGINIFYDKASGMNLCNTCFKESRPSRASKYKEED